MRSLMISGNLILISGLFLAGTPSMSQSAEKVSVLASDLAPDEVPPPGAQTTAPTLPKKVKPAGRDSGKDAEGTAAPNRFEAETVIKSQYTLDGKPLEVDPD